MKKQLAVVVAMGFVFIGAIADVNGFTQTADGVNSVNGITTQITAERPIVQFSQNGGVVESRPLSDDEYQAYQGLSALSQQIELETAPLEAWSKRIEGQSDIVQAKAEAFEAVLLQLRQARRNGTDNTALQQQRAQLKEELDLAVSDIKRQELSQRPSAGKIKQLSSEIHEIAQRLQTLILKDHAIEQYDSIEIIDPQSGHNLNFLGSNDNDNDNDYNDDNDNDYNDDDDDNDDNDDNDEVADLAHVADDADF